MPIHEDLTHLCIINVQHNASKDYNMIQPMGLDVPNCTTLADKSRITNFYADSICHSDLNRPECNFDGGDCACQDQNSCGNFFIKHIYLIL